MQIASQRQTVALWTPEIGRTVYLDGRAQSFAAWWEGDAAKTPPQLATGAKKE
ncbi:hypothetical protein D3C81_2154110 [compost metagenome]